MVNGVCSNRPVPIVIQRLAGVGVDVKAREVAARNIYSNTVTLLKNDGRGIHLDGERINLPGLHQGSMFEGLALSRAYDSVLDIQFDTGREILTGRVNVYQFGCEISVRGVRRSPQFHS